MPALTQKQAIKEYKALEQWVSSYSHPIAQADQTAIDAYYKEREVFVAQLSAFIRQRGNMSALSGAQMLGLCSMVSTYRPMEPFSFLIQCAKEIE